jgi:hypothetical protein
MNTLVTGRRHGSGSLSSVEIARGHSVPGCSTPFSEYLHILSTTVAAEAFDWRFQIQSEGSDR